MKKANKLIALVLCLVLVCAGSVFATVAYLTARDSVLNTFTVGKVSLILDETAVDKEGQPVHDATGAEIKTEEGNKYHLVPGCSYQKDPTVTVKAGSDESYVRMIVTINKYAELLEVFGDDFLPENYVAGWDKETWIPFGTPVVDKDKNTVSYEFRYKETVETMNQPDLRLAPLFEKFALPSELDVEDLEKLTDLKIAIDGHAIQAATFGNADAAWAAFDVQYTAP